jgi:hypothetical protein
MIGRMGRQANQRRRILGRGDRGAVVDIDADFCRSDEQRRPRQRLIAVWCGARTWDDVSI